MSSPSERLAALQHVHGTRFCVVYMEVLDAATQQVRLSTVLGSAQVLADRLALQADDGARITVPDSALGSVFKSDGNEMLKDAAYYAIVKVLDQERSG